MSANRPPEVPDLPCSVGDQTGGMYRSPETIEMMKNKCMHPGTQIGCWIKGAVPNTNPEPPHWYYYRSCEDCRFLEYDRKRNWWSGLCRRTKKPKYLNFDKMQHACKHFDPIKRGLTEADKRHMAETEEYEKRKHPASILRAKIGGKSK